MTWTAPAERRYTSMGRSQTAQEWADEIGVCVETVRSRMSKMGAEVGISRLKESCDARRSAQAAIPPGHPNALSWDDLEWKDDPWAQYVVAHHPEGLTQDEVGQLLGVSKQRVEQIEKEALRKLSKLGAVKQWRGHKLGARETVMAMLEMEGE